MCRGEDTTSLPISASSWKTEAGPASGEEVDAGVSKVHQVNCGGERRNRVIPKRSWNKRGCELIGGSGPRIKKLIISIKNREVIKSKAFSRAQYLGKAGRDHKSAWGSQVFFYLEWGLKATN